MDTKLEKPQVFCRVSARVSYSQRVCNAVVICLTHESYRDAAPVIGLNQVGSPSPHACRAHP